MKIFTHHSLYVWLAYAIAALVLGVHQWQTRQSTKRAEQEIQSP